MILVADSVLNDRDLTFMRELNPQLEDNAGAESAVGDLRSVKHNRQLKLGAHVNEVRDRVRAACPAQYPS